MEVANTMADLPHCWCKTTIHTPSIKDNQQQTLTTSWALCLTYMRKDTILKHLTLFLKIKIKLITTGSCHLSYAFQEWKELPAECYSPGAATPVATELWGPRVKHKTAHAIIALSRALTYGLYQIQQQQRQSLPPPPTHNTTLRQPLTGATSKRLLL